MAIAIDHKISTKLVSHSPNIEVRPLFSEEDEKTLHHTSELKWLNRRILCILLSHGWFAIARSFHWSFNVFSWSKRSIIAAISVKWKLLYVCAHTARWGKTAEIATPPAIINNMIVDEVINVSV